MLLAGWSRPTEGTGGVLGRGIRGDLESPTSTLTFSENVVVPPIMATRGGGGVGENSVAMIEFVGSSSSCERDREWKEEGFGNSSQLPEYNKEGNFENNSMSFTSHEMTLSIEATWTAESLRSSTTRSSDGNINIAEEAGFTNLLLNCNTDERSLSDGGGDDSENGSPSDDYYEDNKNYWNSILNLVNSSPSDSSIF